MGRGFRRRVVPSVRTSAHRLLAALTLVATVAACKEAARPAAVAAIAMVKAVDSVYVGGTREVTASLTDAQGNFLTRPITWSSDAEHIATISESGVVSGVAKGSAQIKALVEGKQASMTMNVQEPVFAVSIVPSTFDLELGRVLQLIVTITDKTGTALSGRVVTFQTSAPAVATVSAGGIIVPVAEGAVTITATSEGKTATSEINVIPARVASITISPPGPQTVAIAKTLQLTATLRDGNGTILTDRPITWNSSNSFVATVSPTGVVTGKTIGQVQITAECEGRVAGIGVQVVVPLPASVNGTSSSLGSTSGTAKR